MTNPMQKKINARGRYQLRSIQSDRSIDVLIRTEQKPSSEEEQDLNGAGYRPRSIIGNVSSGVVVDVQHLEKVAELPFVRQIELASPMFEESQN